MKSQGLTHGTLFGSTPRVIAGHDLDEEGAFYFEVADEDFFSFQNVCEDAGYGTVGEVGVELRVARHHNIVKKYDPLARIGANTSTLGIKKID